MPFSFRWYDAQQSIMLYVAEGFWNWQDYHNSVRASLFALHQHPLAVDSLIDLRASTRPAMPAGLLPHLRTFGKRLSPALSGRAALIGFPHEAEAQLPLAAAHLLTTEDGQLYFAGDEAEALAWLHGQRR